MTMKFTVLGKTIGCAAVLCYVILAGACLYGWVMNIVYLWGCDFDPSYKAEILRIIGIFVPPIGIFLGIFPNAVGR